MGEAAGAESQNNPMDGRCTAHSKRSGERCMRRATTGYTVCHMHGARGGAPKGSKNARKHGVYETVAVDHLPPDERAVFDAMPSDPSLTMELRILRLKLWRLLGPLERQEVLPMYDGPQTVTLPVDEVTRATAIAKLVNEIRKLVKDMQGGSGDDQLFALIGAIRQARRERYRGEDDGDEA